MSDDARGADAEHRTWLREMLGEAAAGLDAAVEGEPVFGWRDRSVGVPVRTRTGQAWLRVVAERTEWTGGEFWTGNVDAAGLEGVAKPRLLRYLEWVEGPVSVRAELMSFVTGQRCSDTPELRRSRDSLELPDAWWADLAASLEGMAKADTDRTAVDDEDIARRLLVFFGDRVNPTVERWSAAHADLHWGNLMRPTLSIVDWEGWGLAPAGYDAATLYLHSLLVGDAEATVKARLADVLDSRDGLISQLHVTARMLERALGGDYPNLAAPLHRNALGVIGRLARR